MAQTLTLPSFAKINWTLEILGKRTDGYHELRTLLQTVSLADELVFSTIEQGIEIVCDHPEIPTDETNLVYRAAKMFSELTGINRGLRIVIKKNIPAAAGLGGGSSNAAVTLIALQKMWGIELATEDLFALGSKLGADVPFFFMGGTCLGIGRGDEVYPLTDINPGHLLLVNPGTSVPTREVYANLPPELTKHGVITKMPLSLDTAYASITTQYRQIRLQNDLEISAFRLYPKLVEVGDALSGLKAAKVLMSGSGSTFFAIFETETLRSAAQSELSQKGWWCESVRTLSRIDYQTNFSAGAG